MVRTATAWAHLHAEVPLHCCDQLCLGCCCINLTQLEHPPVRLEGGGLQLVQVYQLHVAQRGSNTHAVRQVQQV